jgi:hypothetical protein
LRTYPSEGSGSVRDSFYSCHAGTVGAAEESTVCLDAVTDNLHTAVFADRGESVDGTLEAVEGTCLAAGHPNLEGFIVIITADLALGHLRAPFPDGLLPVL